MGYDPTFRLAENMIGDSHSQKALHIIDIKTPLFGNLLYMKITRVGDYGCYFVPVNILQAEKQILLVTSD